MSKTSSLSSIPTLILRVTAMATAAGMAATVLAQPPAPPDGTMRPPPGPPPEAVQACSGLAAGTACSFTGRRGDTIAGSCSVPPPPDAPAAPDGGGAVLACDNPAFHHHHPPPDPGQGPG